MIAALCCLDAGYIENLHLVCFWKGIKLWEMEIFQYWAKTQANESESESDAFPYLAVYLHTRMSSSKS